MKFFRTGIVLPFLKTIGKAETPGSTAVTVISKNSAGKVTEAQGATVPSDAEAGFAKGCRFTKTDGSVGSTHYINEGSDSSCDFNVMETSASTITGVTAGSGLTGTATEGTATLVVGAGRGTTVRADNVDAGIDVYNNTGGTLTAGTLVQLTSFTTTNGIVVVKADADAGLRATHVVADAINNNTAGVVYPVATVTGLATNGRTIGDKVYLDATTAGAFAFSAPTGADQISQVVGVVKVVDAAVGEIVFFPGSAQIEKIATSMLQDDAVSAAKIADSAIDAAAKIVNGVVTPIKLAASEALTATADGLTTGLMTGLTSHVVVTSAAATDAVTLPASSAGLLGKPFTIWVGANGFELLTPASSGATINGTDSDGTNQADIPANSLSRLTLVTTDTWILENIGSTGTVAAAIVPDND